jgi:hypothetical protein
MAMATMRRRRAYSTAEAPESSAAKRKRRLPISNFPEILGLTAA